jgi:hypothetical protein
MNAPSASAKANEKFSFKNDFSKVERIPSVPKYFM